LISGKLVLCEITWNFIDMQCRVVKIVPENWRKLISDRFYCMRNLKLKNIVTKIVEIQVISRGTRFRYQVTDAVPKFFNALAMAEMLRGMGDRTCLGKGEFVVS
jgi:hypothetical protein